MPSGDNRTRQLLALVVVTASSIPASTSSTQARGRPFARASPPRSARLTSASGSSARARYGTLIPVRATAAVTPFAVAKRDRRGWVVIAPTRAAQGTLETALEA